MSRERDPRPERELTPEEHDRLERGWDAFEAGDLDAAYAELGRLPRRIGDHPEVRFLAAALTREEGEAVEALAELEAIAERVGDELLHAYYVALAHLDLARFEEAEAEFTALESSDLDPGLMAYLLAQVREHLGRLEEAEEDYQAAHAEDPSAFPLPLRIARAEFEEILHEAEALLPETIRGRLGEVPVVVEDLPPRALLAHPEGEGLAPDLLGLFVGRSLREESSFEVPDVPAAIYLYKRNLERACRTREELREEIATTLYHELGHYLGLDEDELEERGID